VVAVVMTSLVARRVAEASQCQYLFVDAWSGVDNTAERVAARRRVRCMRRRAGGGGGAAV
jgi:hypothetical protein